MDLIGRKLKNNNKKNNKTQQSLKKINQKPTGLDL
jgi:hypothetical protein